MYLVIKTKHYDKSLLRLVKSGRISKTLRDKLDAAVDTIAIGNKLALNYRDHELKCDYKGYQECHIQGNLLPVYKIEKQELVLILIDIDSHSYLF